MSAAPATETPAGVPSERLDALFHGPLEKFTQARNELAKQLRADGSGDAAGWVKGLRKPTRAAWLVNQLAARKRDAVKRLVSIGEELRALQAKLIDGRADREALRAAAQREQGAIEELVRAAQAIGREHGVGGQILDRVAETLQAASSDPQVAEALARGRLQREARATSLGLVGEATGAPARRTGKAKQKGEDAAERRERQRLARRRRTAERAVARAEQRLERERGAVERAREALEERERRLEEAERELAKARDELE